MRREFPPVPWETFFRVGILWFRRSIPNELVFLYTMIQLFEKYFKFCLSFTPSRLEHKNSICYYSLLVKNNHKPVDQLRRNVCLECSSGLRRETLAWNDKVRILISSMGRRNGERDGGTEGQKEGGRVREKKQKRSGKRRDRGRIAKERHRGRKRQEQKVDRRERCSQLAVLFRWLCLVESWTGFLFS